MLGVETAPSFEGLKPASFMNSDLFDADDDSDEEVVRSSKPKKTGRQTKALRLILSDDEEEQEEDDLLTNLAEKGISQADKILNSPVNKINGSADTDEEDKESDDESLTTKYKEKVPSSSDSEEGDSSEEGEEDDEEEEIAFQLTPPAPEPETETNGEGRSSRRRRLKKDELQQIHSESQRIVRESTIRIPYHRPTPLTLDELFSKKPSVTALTSVRGKVPRMPLVNDTQLNVSQKVDKPTDTAAKDKEDELPDVLSSQSLEDNKENKQHLKTDGAASQVDSSVCKQDFEDGQKGGISPEDESGMDTDSVSSPRRASGDGRSELQCNEECSDSNSPMSGQGESSPKSEQIDGTLTSTPRDPKQSLQASQGCVDGKDSGVVATPVFKTPSNVPVPAHTPTSGQQPPLSAQARRMKLLQESLSKLKGVQPKLSGSPGISLDLDEGATPKEPSPEQKGVNRLMKRYVAHTRHHPKTTPKKEVQINIVTKEKGEDGKEDLKHHTISVGLEGTPAEIDPALKVPGAKLTRLKQNLQAGMKVRREQERKKRQEAFQLDNEEGYGGGEDEDEAELTDGSETDEEGPTGGKGKKKRMDEEDEEDEDYVPGNEFVDDEADSDDADDDENDDEEEDDDEGGAMSGDELNQDDSKIKKSTPAKGGRRSGVESDDNDDDDDDEISPSRRKGTRKRTMVVADEEEEEEDDEESQDHAIGLHLDSTETDDTDTEISDALQDSAKFSAGGLVRTPRTISALDQCSKTVELFDSATNSTGTSDFQVPSLKGEGSARKVTWSSGKESDSSKDSSHFILPAPVRQDSSSNSLDTSFEMMTSLIPAHQPEGGTRRSGRASVDSNKGERCSSFTPFSRHQSGLSGAAPKTMSRSELSLPVEDSQDLFREDSPRLPTILDSQQATESQSFHFSFEDETQTQFLDENGLLNLKPSSGKSQPSKQKALFGATQAQSTESQSSMEELLGLCSGQFNETQGGSEAKDDMPGPFSQVSQRNGSQGDMDELLDLCSGTFTGMNAKSQVTSTMKEQDKAAREKTTANDDEDDDDIGNTHSFHILSDPDGADSDDDHHKDHGFSDVDGDDDENDDDIDVKRRQRKRIRVMDEDEDSDDDDGRSKRKGDEEDEADESDLDSEFGFEVNKKTFKGKTYGKSMKLANFVEAEAELSGSEADSDENYDAEDEPDDEDLEGIVHEEEGDQDELRNQVNKVHMKTMDDDDARRLRIYKEMYLPDGDLHSDSKGRERKFRWRHVDSQVDMFRADSEGEEDEEEAKNAEDTQWRLQRYQREQWLKESEGKDKPSDGTPEALLAEENSQFAKLLRTASIKKPRGETPTQEVDEKGREKEKEKKVGTPKPLRIVNQRGSFLNRSKNDLAKMASLLKPLSNPQGPRNSRNFVFQSAESSQSEEAGAVSEPPKVKRSASVSGPSSGVSPAAGPKAKRPRLERSQSQFTTNSVFRHF